MRRTFFSLGLLVLVCPVTAIVTAAQEKISGTIQCAKPDPQHVVPVEGMPGHSLVVDKSKCTWTKPMEIAGLQTKDAVLTSTADVSATVISDHGYSMTTMTNGDTLLGSFSDTVHPKKDGSFEAIKATWAFLNGSGKLKGIKGKGTYQCKPSGDANTCDVEGEYTLPK
jgi:hypothetical protein